MAIDLITTTDLEDFKDALLSEIENLLIENNKISLDRWIRSKDVMDKLQISHGSLQNLRNKGIIPCSKIGGIILYDQFLLHKILEANDVKVS